MTPPKTETPEEKRRRLDKRNAERRKGRSEETPDQRKKRLAQRSASTSSRKGKETEEQRRERLNKSNERRKLTRAQETAEQRQNRLEKRKRNDLSKTVEERRATLNRKKVRERERRRKLPEEKAEEIRQKQKMYHLMKTVTRTEEEKEEERKKRYFYWEANKWRWRRGNMSEEDKERRREVQRNWVRSLTGEKKRRYQDSVARALKKSLKKQLEKLREDPVKWEEHKQKTAEYRRKRYAEESPERKLRRRRKCVVNHAKRRLKSDLKEQKKTPEEIEKELVALGDRMWREFYPEENFPCGRPGRRKKVPPATMDSQEETAVREVFAVPTCDNRREDLRRENKYITLDLGHPFTAVPVISPPCGFPTETGVHEEPMFTIDIEFEAMCSFCPAKFPSEVDLRPHLMSSHLEKCWKCPICEAIELSPQQLSQHYSTAHPDIPSKGDTIQIETPTTSQEKNNGNFFCMKCPPSQIKRCSTREELFSHVNQEHPLHFWPCQECQLLKYSEGALRTHQRICLVLPKS